MKKKDIVGFLLLSVGVAGILGGIRGASGGDNWGGPAIGAGAVANVVAYRVLRAPPIAKREDDPSSKGGPQV